MHYYGYRPVCHLLSVVLLAGIVSFVSLAEGSRSLSAQLISTVEVDKKQIANGDQLNIVATVRNVGKDAAYLSVRPDPYAVMHIKMYNSIGIPLPRYLTVIFELARLQKEDFAELKPGDKISFRFKGIVRKATLQDIREEEGSAVRGLFLDFGTSAILLPGNGYYKLAFELVKTEGFADLMQDELGLKHVWHGTTVSEPTIVEVAG
jgi:hypothetical protein